MCIIIQIPSFVFKAGSVLLYTEGLSAAFLLSLCILVKPTRDFLQTAEPVSRFAGT